jgi:hypothetical protein
LKCPINKFKGSEEEAKGIERGSITLLLRIKDQRQAKPGRTAGTPTGTQVPQKWPSSRQYEQT